MASNQSLYYLISFLFIKHITGGGPVDFRQINTWLVHLTYGMDVHQQSW